MNNIKTSNDEFNSAWNKLKEYHLEVHVFPLYVTLDLSNRPKIDNNLDWKFYLNAIHSLLVIGKRNNWVTTEVDGNGFPVFFLINRNIYDGSKI